MKDVVESEVFNRFPTFIRGVVVANDVRIAVHNPRIATFLIEETSRRKPMAQSLLDSPPVVCWDDAHKKFGSNPKKFPPSIRSLLQRVSNGKPLPYINDAVALFNAVSLKHLLPCGGDDLNVIKGDLCLGLASGQETFCPLGSSEMEYPEPQEVIYYDTGDSKVLCRRWNWRNGNHTKLTVATRRMLINVDGIAPDSRPLVEAATNEIAAWIHNECRGEVQCFLLDRSITSIDVSHSAR